MHVRCCLLLLACLFPRVAPEIALGAFAGVTSSVSPGPVIAWIAAYLDYQKHWNASLVERFGPPIVTLPGGLHPNGSAVTLRIGTTHLQTDIGVATAIDMMWGLDGAAPVTGLVGAGISSITMPVATIAAVQKVPVVAFASTNSALSNKDLYPFFLRTVSPDSIQALALWAWIAHFEVALATCLYSLESYGQGLFSEMEKLAQAQGKQDFLQGLALRYMQDFAVEEAREVLYIAKRLGSRFILLAMNSHMLAGLLPLMREEGMMEAGWQVVGTDACISYVDQLPSGFMLFSPLFRGPLFPQLAELWSQLSPDDIFGRYHLDKMKMPLDHQWISDLLSGGAAALNVWDSLAFDALYTLFVAINNLLHTMSESEIREEALLDELRRTRFMGVSGEVSFDENGDRLAAYQLINLQEMPGLSAPQAVPAAMFSASTLNFTFERQPVWMDGSRRAMPPEELFSCDPGFYKEVSGQCKICPRGKQCSGGPVASYVLCPRGAFANRTRMQNCTLCPKGRFAPDVGSEECNTCLPGYEAPMEGMEACRRCAIGTYMPLSEGLQCFPCPGNLITRESASESESDCICPEGFFLCGDSCRECPAGLHCPEGLSRPLQQGGFWTEGGLIESQCDFAVLRCRDASECLPEATLGDCAPGREGRACNNCQPDHFPRRHPTALAGTCQPCREVDLLPGAILFVFIPVVLLLLSFLTMEPSQLSLNLLTAAAVVSQLIVALQTLGSMRQLSLAWQEPVLQILDLALNVLTLDLDFVRITCIYGADSPVMKFTCKLVACPIACSFPLASWCFAKWWGRPKPFDTVLNLCGLLSFAFFLAIALATLTPFQCVSNPSGVTSMATDPGVICYDSEEHTVLVILAVIGVLSQPVAFLTVATYATVMYPSWVASGRGLRLLNRYRFLFHRFKSERYYYGLVLLCRNGLVALLPIVAVDLLELQVPAMGLILMVSLVLLAGTCPWRTQQANQVDLLLTGLLLLILLGVAPLLELDLTLSSSFLGWLLCFPVAGLLLVTTVALLRALLGHFKQQRRFGVFLCHHKAGAGSLCRLMKIMIARRSSTRVFLDCDQLQKLDLLFDIVRTSTQSMAVVLTPELLKRVWCAGEITTAWKNKITTVPLVCDGFQPLCTEALQQFPSLWTPEQTQLLANYGVEIADVAHAYAWLQHDLTPLSMPRFGSVWAREEAVRDMLARCGVLSSVRSLSGSLSGIGSGSGSRLSLAPSRARILILSSVADAESLSACEVFQLMLQDHLKVECAVIHGRRQMVSWKPYAYYLVVLLFRGIFNDQGFARTLLAAFHAPGRSLELMTVIADTHFEFPSLEQDVSSPFEHESIEDAERRQQLTQAFRKLVNVLALPFSPLASEGLQRRQVAEIAGRMHRYEDPAAAAWRDEADDRLADKLVREEDHVQHQGSLASCQSELTAVEELEGAVSVPERGEQGDTVSL